MKFSIEAALLAKAVKHAAGFADKRGVNPWMGCVRIAVDGSEVTLQATDLDLSLSRVIAGATSERDGVALVNADRLARVLAEVASSAEQVTVEVPKDEARLTVGGVERLRASMPIEAADLFGDLPTFPARAKPWVMDAASLLAASKQVAPAADDCSASFTTSGVLFVCDGKGFARFVATDKRRLHSLGVECSGPKSEVGVLVTPRTLDAVASFAVETEAEVSMAVDGRQAFFRVGSALIGTRLLDGKFPSWEEIIPKQGKVVAKIAAADLALASKRAMLLASKTERSARVTFGVDGLTIESRAEDVGTIAAECPGKMKGEIVLGLMPHYLADIARAFDPAREIVLSASATNAPVRVESGEFLATIAAVGTA